MPSSRIWWTFIGCIFVLLVLSLLKQDLPQASRIFNGNVVPGYPIHVGFLIFATGKYIKYADVFVKSMRRYFDCPLCNTTYVIFTDNPIDYQLIGWPYDTLKRVHAFKKSQNSLAHFDYLFAIDADMRLRSRVGMEILGDLVGTLHPAFYQNKIRGTYENDSRSSAYIAPNEGGYYFAGGFFGGKAAMFWPLVKKMTEIIDKDLQRNYIAIWHDESYLNRCFMDTPPEIILSPAYCSPEHWPLPYEKKIVAISKRHSVARN